MDINQKSIISMARIESSILAYGTKRCAVACSFGKDSMTVLDMAMKIDPEIPVVWCDTGVEFKDTIDFSNRIEKEWNLNLFIARPEKGINFWTLVDKYGLPQIRGFEKNREPKCCVYLKNNPAEKVYKELGTKCILTGITAAESRSRWFLKQRMANKAQSQGVSPDDIEGFGCGAKYLRKKDNRYMLHPIIDWNEKDVWDYTIEKDVPINPHYIKFPGSRLGCRACTAYKNWEITMCRESPATYEKIIKIKDKINRESNVESYIQPGGCFYFDSIITN